MKKVKIRSRTNYKLMGLWISVFAIAGIGALLWARAAEPIRIDNSLPQVRNVKVFPDDRVITVTWDAPNNASSAGIVGYFVEYGETALGTFPYNKQTTYNAVQIQPVDNNKEYTIRVYAAHGSTVRVPITNGSNGVSQVEEKRGSGRVSPAVVAKATPVSTRVDQLRQRMTGFFDDFNTTAGAFDELKWNQAGSMCAQPGTIGAFINNQHHSHNQASSISQGESDGYCDRTQMATRARGVFDIAGRTDASPGEIVFDMDGASRVDDGNVWYLDLIPTNARSNGAPVDVTAHASVFDDEQSDPMGIRISQSGGEVKLHYYDINKNPHVIEPTYTCFDWRGYDGCNPANKTAGLSPLAEPDLSFVPIPNIRRHWVVRMTNQKITIFIDSVRILEAPIPADFRNITKYQIHSTIFSYNTGKHDNDPVRNNAQTFLFHWDNFGFNGPQSPTVVHNYVEGGPTGNTPYLGRGTLANPTPYIPWNTTPKRLSIIPIPDQIGSPAKARLHFTITGSGWYTWSSSHNIKVNNNTYPFAHPREQVPEPRWPAWVRGPDWINPDGNSFGNANNPMAFSIDINPAHLIRGQNRIELNLDGHNQMIINIHIELEYNRGTQPSAYTQPTQIFGKTLYDSFIIPPMTSHDRYLFVEQNLDLASADNHGNPEPETCPAGTTGTPPNCVTPEPEPDPEDPTFKAGDINRDGNVSFADLALLLSNYGRTQLTGDQVNSDLNKDGSVNFGDLAILLSNYGE